MYISQCIIAKNEESNIEYCLRHMKEVVDEQIVVDTGSTDRTVEIAEKLGAKVFHFDWIDDFSAARNFALDKAKGDWIIFLDCDEYFSDSSVPLVKKYIKEIHGNRNINGILTQLINIDKDKNVISVVENVSPRIFRKKRNMRYKKRIHEYLQDSHKPIVCDNRTEDLKILHTGYDRSIVDEKNKNKIYISMLKKELEQNPEDSHTNLYISISLYMDGEYEESLEYARQSLMYADEIKDAKHYPLIYMRILNAMLYTEPPYDEIREIFEEAVGKYPQYPDYYRIMGLIESNLGNRIAAVEMMKKCIYYCQNYKSDIESVALGQIEDVYSELLNACILADNRPGIVETSVALLNMEKYSYENLTVLIKTLLTSEDEESIIGFLTKIYDYSKFKDKIYLLKASKQCENEKMILYFTSILSEEEKQAVERL